MVIRAALGGADEGEVIDHPGNVGEQLGYLDAALTMFLEAKRALHQRSGISLAHPNGTFPGQGPAMVLGERRLRVEGINLAHAATHEKRDDGLGPGLEMARSGGDG